MGASSGQEVPSNAKAYQETPGKPGGTHKVLDWEEPGEARNSQEEQKEPRREAGERQSQTVQGETRKDKWSQEDPSEAGSSQEEQGGASGSPGASRRSQEEP